MTSTVLLKKDEIAQILDKLRQQILSAHQGEDQLVLVGIKRRGADLAERLRGLLEEALQRAIPLGELDINLYRDDWTKLDGKPVIGTSVMPVGLDGKVVILIDDVLFSGRTVRAALEALFDYGRPKKVELLALVDRGNRELPIAPDYTGFFIATKPDAHIDVLLEERDGADAVVLG